MAAMHSHTVPRKAAMRIQPHLPYNISRQNDASTFPKDHWMDTGATGHLEIPSVVSGFGGSDHDLGMYRQIIESNAGIQCRAYFMHTHLMHQRRQNRDQKMFRKERLWVFHQIPTSPTFQTIAQYLHENAKIRLKIGFPKFEADHHLWPSS